MSDKNMWDYRVVRKTEHGEEWLSVQEVYYDDDKPMAQSIDLQVEGVTISEMKTQLELMLKSLEESVLDESDILDTSNIETEPVGTDGHGNDLYIYESPDDGKTIFRRQMGDDKRTKHHVTRPGILATGDLADVMPDSALEGHRDRLEIKELKDRLSRLEDRVIKGL